MAAAATALLFAPACIGGGDGGDDAREPTPSYRPAAAARGGTVRVAAEQEPAGFNIHVARHNLFSLQQIVDGVYPSVFRVHPDGRVHLDRELMRSAELIEDDPQTVEYRMHPKAVWSDGKPIGAEDFRFLWRSCNGTRREATCGSIVGYEDIARVTGSNRGRTIRVVFRQPFADWRSLFTNLLPAHHATKRGGFDKGLDQPPTVSGGPMLITGYDRGRELRLTRNDRFWGRPANLDSVIVRFIADGPAQVQALIGSEVDVVAPQLHPEVAPAVKAAAGVTTTVRPSLVFEHLTFNTRRGPLREVKVRRALAHLVDRNAIVRAVAKGPAPGAVRADNRLWLQGQPHHVAHGEDYRTRQTAAAAELLDDAGYDRKGGGYRKDGKPLALRLVTTTGLLRQTEADLIASQLTAAGVPVSVEAIAPRELFEKRLPAGDFDLAVFAWTTSPHPASVAKAVYATGSESNYGRYAQAAVDKLFKKALAANDAKAYARHCNRIDERLWEDMANLPLLQRPSVLAFRSTLVNVRDNVSGDGPLWNVRDWGFK